MDVDDIDNDNEMNSSSASSRKNSLMDFFSLFPTTREKNNSAVPEDGLEVREGDDSSLHIDIYSFTSLIISLAVSLIAGSSRCPGSEGCFSGQRAATADKAEGGRSATGSDSNRHSDMER